MSPNADYEDRPDSWPNRLRAIAQWLDLTDPIVATYMKKAGADDPNLSKALECVGGRDMQADLLALADILDEYTDSVPHIPSSET